MMAMNELINGMVQGRTWSAMGDSDAVRALLYRVYDERYHRASHHRDRFQLRVNLQKKDDAASYAGWITSENPTSGPYQGTSFVWFPGVQGSVAVLVIGTDGFGADTAILGRPGHARRLRALSIPREDGPVLLVHQIPQVRHDVRPIGEGRELTHVADDDPPLRHQRGN
jgi:5-methylcytosine-specific restriction protein B